MILKWNGLGLLGVMGAKSDKPLTLFPGLNSHVTKDDWAVIEKHPIIKEYIATGKMELIASESPKKSPAAQLCEMKPIDAMKAAKETTDVKLLKEWAALEKRGEVSVEIKKQIEAIEAPLQAAREKKDDKKEKKNKFRD